MAEAMEKAPKEDVSEPVAVKLENRGADQDKILARKHRNRLSGLIAEKITGELFKVDSQFMEFEVECAEKFNAAETAEEEEKVLGWIDAQIGEKFPFITGWNTPPKGKELSETTDGKGRWRLFKKSEVEADIRKAVDEYLGNSLTIIYEMKETAKESNVPIERDHLVGSMGERDFDRRVTTLISEFLPGILKNKVKMTPGDVAGKIRFKWGGVVAAKTINEFSRKKSG